MTNDLLTKATTLIEAKHWPAGLSAKDSDYGIYAAGKRDSIIEATPIIHGYQDLLRHMAAAMEENDKVLAALPSLKAVTFTETELDMMRRVACLKKQALKEARAALPQLHTTTTS